MEPQEGLLLGKNTPVVEVYSPQLLFPIPRSQGRSALGIGAELPFHGVDVWHAYEMSWLDDNGKPVARVGRFQVPADSPNIVESKSFKLYLNSLNNSHFVDDLAAIDCITRDIAAAACAPVELSLFPVDDPALSGAQLAGQCLDNLSPSGEFAKPDDDALLGAEGEAGEFSYYSHLLRSLCPVTGQPDWATLWLNYRGTPMDVSGLLAYIIAYRSHQEFHEQCVERIFCDISNKLQPEFLQVQAFYTRRGGLDINPFRSSDPASRPLPRLNRQ